MLRSKRNPRHAICGFTVSGEKQTQKSTYKSNGKSIATRTRIVVRFFISHVFHVLDFDFIVHRHYYFVSRSSEVETGLVCEYVHVLEKACPLVRRYTIPVPTQKLPSLWTATTAKEATLARLRVYFASVCSFMWMFEWLVADVLLRHHRHTALLLAHNWFLLFGLHAQPGGTVDHESFSTSVRNCMFTVCLCF